MSSRNKRRTPQGQRSQPAPPPGPQAVPGSSPVQTDQAPAPAPADDKQQLNSLLQRLEAERGSKVLIYWTSDLARISEAAVLSLYDQLAALGRQEQLDLVLYTRGGDTEVPWRMVSLIREFARRFCVLVPHRAASAGTLIAMGADEIVMPPLGVLGPIDPSRTHPLLPRPSGGEPEPVSVQDMRHAMQFIREAAGTDKEMPYTPEAMAQIFTALFDKLHPLAIGAIEQSYALSKLIGMRCLESHMDHEADAPKIKSIVDTLCDDYKSHGYQINRGEARRIGLNAVDAEPAVEAALVDVLKLFTARPLLPPTPPTPGKPFQMHIAWLESTEQSMRVEGTYIVDKDGNTLPQGDAWTVY